MLPLVQYLNCLSMPSCHANLSRTFHSVLHHGFSHAMSPLSLSPVFGEPLSLLVDCVRPNPDISYRSVRSRQFNFQQQSRVDTRENKEGDGGLSYLHSKLTTHTVR